MNRLALGLFVSFAAGKPAPLRVAVVPFITERVYLFSSSLVVRSNGVNRLST
jgi:hypothetical protein